MDPQVLSTLERIKLEKDIFSKAKLIKYLVHEKELRLSEIAKNLSAKPSYLSNILRILKLPDLVVDGYYTKTISLTHLIIISRLPVEQAVDLYEKILSNNLTALQTEEIVRERLYDVKTKGNKLDEGLKNDLIEQFKKVNKEINVKVTQTQVKGKIEIELKGNRQKTTEFLEELLETIKQ